MPIGKAIAAVTSAVQTVKASVQVTGKPLLERDKPASVSIFGITFFNRDENLERTYLGGLIKRGRSAYAKQALAARAGTTATSECPMCGRSGVPGSLCKQCPNTYPLPNPDGTTGAR